MNKHNKKTARLLQGVALGLIIIATALLLGCENPVGGIENNPLSDFAGKVYKDSHGTLFSISKQGTDILISITSDYDNTQGKVISSKSANEGTVYLLECSTHSNYDHYQYPDYDEDNPHTGCYLPLYIRSITNTTVEWATFYTAIDTKSTACFAHSSKEKAREYLDFSKWDPLTYGCSTGSVQN